MAVKEYLDFDLQIEKDGRRYRAQVLESPSGQATRIFTLPFNEAELERFLQIAGRPLGDARRVARDTPEARTFGTKLFDAVFSNGVRSCIDSSLNEADQQGMGLRIRLRLADAPLIGELPWEYLYHSDRGRFLALSVETPVVRYLELPNPERPLKVKPPLRVLVASASPRGYALLDAKTEWKRLNDALSDLQKQQLVILDRLDHTTADTLRQQLRSAPYHILHFIGHGGFDQANQDSVLILEDDQGNDAWLSGQDLGVLLNDHRTLRLAVLNACEGARAGRDSLFSGVAQSLVRQSIPAVIAMQFPITDKAATEFSCNFYKALSEGEPVDSALGEARKAVYSVHRSSLEWGAPVLYLRTRNGEIFDLRDRTEEVLVVPPLPGPTTTKTGDAPAQPGVEPIKPQRTPGPMLLYSSLALVLMVLAGYWFWQQSYKLTSGRLVFPLTAAADASDKRTGGVASLAAQAQSPSVAATAMPHNTDNNAPGTPNAAQPGAPTSTLPKPWFKAERCTQSTGTWCAADRDFMQHGGPVTLAAFSPDQKYMATVGADQTVHIWDWLTGEPLTTLNLAGEGVRSLSFSADSQWLAIADGHLHLLKTGQWTPALSSASPLGQANVEQARFQPKLNQLATLDNRGNLTLWSLPEEKATTYPNVGTNGQFDLSPNGKQVVFAVGRMAVVRDLASNQALKLDPYADQSNPNDQNKALTGVAFSPDGQWVATASKDKTVRLWASTTGELLYSSLAEADQPGFLSVTFSPDGRWLLATGEGAQVYLWDVGITPIGRPVTLYGAPEILLDARFSPDGTMIVTTAHNREARLFVQKP